ncbi:hypothetical protein VTJ83DRAFT_7375 [Remersonia thermophila]|uniref:Arrestin C-terminal-like domain-containing protein n=1 Tax=Remersonia thermophila TaxID=72144 RepID=A0ABR4D3B2_9PEZI
MRSLNLFSSSGRDKCAYFDIRLDNDFVVFRGDEHEAAAQLLKGTLVLCISSPLKVESIQLKLTGTARYVWTDTKVTPSGMSSHKTDKTVTILEHRWPPFAGVGAPDPEDRSRQLTKGVTLPPGNYEWPFELMLGGDTTESVEGLREASITYKLKAVVSRPNKILHPDIPAEKSLRVIRTLQASALEFLHAMSIENIWPNKVDYSIVVPQKAVVFGSCIPLEMRLTPLLKGLEVGSITVKLMEVHDFIIQTGTAVREHKKEREIDTWTIPVTRAEHWQDVIEDGGPEGWQGQEGWVVHRSLGLPKRLTQCLQDVNAKGIKIRHKLKVVVSLNNPDGHVSELRATLPVSIFISPNMPPDENGAINRQLPNGASREAATMAPPAYELHKLDQLYEDMDSGAYLASGAASGVSSPLRARSRSASSENLHAMQLQRGAIQPDVLAHRLQSMALDQRHRNLSWTSNLSAAGAIHPDVTSYPADAARGDALTPLTPLTRHSSGEPAPASGFETPPQHLDFLEVAALSRVPSYDTALRTPVRPLTSQDSALPDYLTALSAPASAPGSPRLRAATLGMTGIPAAAASDSHSRSSVEAAAQGEALSRTPPAASSSYMLAAHAVSAPVSRDPSPPASALATPASTHSSHRRPLLSHRRQFSSGFLHGVFHVVGEGDEPRRLHLLQARSG